MTTPPLLTNLQSNWQDKLFAVCALVMSASLVSTILDSQKPTVTTSLTNAVCLLLIGIAEFTIKLRWAAAVTTLQTVAWFVLVVQRVG